MGCCGSRESSESEISDIELYNIQSIGSRPPSITPSRAPSWTQEELDTMFAGLGIQIDPNIDPEELVRGVPHFRPSFPPTPPRTPTPPRAPTPPRNFNTPPRFRNP